MMTLTHLTISGLAISLIVGTTNPVTIGIGAISGLLPDVDVGKSPAGCILFENTTKDSQPELWPSV